MLGGFGGLRLGEMLGLRWGRVDFLRRRVQVAETLVDIEGHIHFGPPKTKAACGRCRCPRSCARSSRRWHRPVWRRTRSFSSPPRAARFARPCSGAASGQPAVDAAELAPLRIHDLRHTAVSLWIADGADPKRVAALAGHTSVVVVLDRYGHLYPEQDEELMERLERRAKGR